MTRKSNHLQRVLDAQAETEQTHDTLTRLDASDPRFYPLLAQYTELLALRRQVEAVHAARRRRSAR